MNVIEEKYSWNGTPTPCSASDKTMIILHHAAASSCTAQDVHRWHLANGWVGIGYHYFVRKDGKIYRGRPELTIGAHTEGYNTVGIGICAEGDYSRETMPRAQKQAIVELCKDIKARRGIHTIKGHRDLNATSCPGGNYPFAEIVNAVNGSNSTANTNTTNNNSEVCDVNLPLLQSGDEGRSVEVLQLLLIDLGYDCGGYGADGIFGAGTLASVKAYQHDIGVVQDGLVGIKTWTHLLT